MLSRAGAGRRHPIFLLLYQKLSRIQNAERERELPRHRALLGSPLRDAFFGGKTLVFGLDHPGGFEQPPWEYKKPRAAEGYSLPGQMMV